MERGVGHFLAVCLAVLLVVQSCQARRRPFIPGKTNNVPESQPTQDTRSSDSEVAGLMRRVNDLELTASSMKSELQTTKAENSALRAEMGAMNDLYRQADEAHNRVEELQRLLVMFERFFGVLYAEAPDAFEREIPVEKRLSALNEYLGNREAELMALRPDPPVFMAGPDEQPDNSEMVGRLVEELSSENHKLMRRLDSMESTMRTVSATGTSKLADALAPGSSQPDEETQERLSRLERILALGLAPLLDDEEDDGIAAQVFSNTDRLASGAATTSSKKGGLSESDTEILKDELYSVRAISSTRKSVFSVAATSKAYGNPGSHDPIMFDHVFTNKGNHFVEGNNTFVCYIPGYYFLTFTARSADGRWMGVNLLKNGEHVTSISGESSPKNQMMSQSVVLHLDEGDRVWVSISPSDMFAVYSDHRRYSTFSGFLLFKGRE